MDWHGCPDPSAYCPPEHCSDPIAHHRIQARKRAEAAFGKPGKAFPPSIHFRGFADYKATARTVYSDHQNVTKPHFDPTPFLKEGRAEPASESAEDGTKQSAADKEKAAELNLPCIPTKNLVGGASVPLLKLSHMARLPEQAQSLSARSATSAFKSTTQRGAKTARETTTGWQPLRSRRVRDEKVDPEQLLKTLFPDMHQDLKLLLDADFVQKLSSVRIADDLEGDVQRRLRVMLIDKAGVGMSGNQDQLEGSEERQANVVGPSDRGRRESIVAGRNSGGRFEIEKKQSPEKPGKKAAQNADVGREAQWRTAICRPVLPQLYLEGMDPDAEGRTGQGQGSGEETLSNAALQAKPEQDLKNAKGFVQAPAKPEQQRTSLTGSVKTSRRRSSGSGKRSSQQEPANTSKKVVSGLEIDTTMRKKMETLASELEEYKRKVHDLEVRLCVTSPHKAEEKLQSMEARLQEQITVLEKQYRLKVENIRAAHRTELADWKASEVESIRTALARACEERLRIATEERAAVEKKLVEAQKQAQAAEESASQEKALRAPVEQEFARLRRHCKAIESRSRALEREILDLQAKAGNSRSAARLLSEQMTSHPPVARHLSLRPDHTDIARHSSPLFEASDSVRAEASFSTIDEEPLSRSNSDHSASAPENGSQTERLPSRTDSGHESRSSSNRFASFSDALLSESERRAARGSSGLPSSGAQAERTASRTDRRATVASGEAVSGRLAFAGMTGVSRQEVLRGGELDGRGSPAAKRTLLNLSSPSLHMSIDFDERNLNLSAGPYDGRTTEVTSREGGPVGPLNLRTKMPPFPPDETIAQKGGSAQQPVSRSLDSTTKLSTGWR